MEPPDPPWSHDPPPVPTPAQSEKRRKTIGEMTPEQLLRRFALWAFVLGVVGIAVYGAVRYGAPLLAGAHPTQLAANLTPSTDQAPECTQYLAELDRCFGLLDDNSGVNGVFKQSIQADRDNVKRLLEMEVTRDEVRKQCGFLLVALSSPTNELGKFCQATRDPRFRQRLAATQTPVARPQKEFDNAFKKAMEDAAKNGKPVEKKLGDSKVNNEFDDAFKKAMEDAAKNGEPAEKKLGDSKVDDAVNKARVAAANEAANRGDEVDPTMRLAGITLGMTKEAVHSKLGAPSKVDGDKESYSGLEVDYWSSNGGVYRLSTTSTTYPTSEGVTVGVSEASLRAKIHGLHCKTYSGRRECTNIEGTGVPKMTFYLQAGHIYKIEYDENPCGQ